MKFKNLPRRGGGQSDRGQRKHWKRRTENAGKHTCGEGPKACNRIPRAGASPAARRELEKLDVQTKAIEPTLKDLDDYRLPGSFNQIMISLVTCRDASKRVSIVKPLPQFVLADEDLTMLGNASHVDYEN